MRLQVGEKAPEFTARTIDGEEVKLEDFPDRRIWLSFLRYAACPLCSFRIHELMGTWSTSFADHGVVLLTVWQSPPEKLEEIRTRYSPPFTLISDPELELFELYRVETSITGVFGKEVTEGIKGARELGLKLMRAWDGPPTRIPADFLIDQDGIIREAFYGRNVAHHIPFDQVESFLAATA